MAYQNLVKNNDTIMDRIRKGTEKLGLIINEDETMKSSSMLIYGKVVIARGLFFSLTGKRVSRILGNTNDQFPNLGSIHASVVTNVLTVCHYSEDLIESVINYNRLGNFSRLLTEMYSPALRGPMKEFLPTINSEKREYNIRYQATIQRRIRVSLKAWAPSIQNELLKTAIVEHDKTHNTKYQNN